MERTRERAQFLSDLLVTMIEHAGYGFPGVLEYVVEPEGDPNGSYAVIYDRYEHPDGSQTRGDLGTWRVDLDTVEKGLEVVRGMSAHSHAAWVRELQLADVTDGDEGDYDVVGALLVLECALFGQGVYS
jgi:hypothetical protein